MGPKPFSKAWREQLIRTYSKARLLRRNNIPMASEKVFVVRIDPLTRKPVFSRQLTDIDVMDAQVRRLLG